MVNSVLKIIILFCTFAIPPSICLIMDDTIDMPKLTIVYFANILFWSTFFISGISKKKINFKRTKLDIPILLFVLINLIATVSSIDFLRSLYGSYKLHGYGFFPLLGFCGLYFATVQVSDENFLRKLAFVLITTATIVSIYGILQTFGIKIFLRMTNSGGKPWSTMGNTIFLAAFLLMVFFLCLGLFFTVQNKLKFYLILPFFIITYTLFVTYARGAYLALFIGLVLFLISSYKILLRYSLFLILLFLIILFSFPKIQERLFSSFDVKNDSASLARIEGWKTAINIIKDKPFLGIGPDSFVVGFRKYRRPEYIKYAGAGTIQGTCHNEFLQIATNCGLFGLLVYLWILYSIFKMGLKQENILKKAIFCGLFAFFFQSMFNPNVTANFAIAVILLGTYTIPIKEKIISLTKLRKTALFLIFSLAISGIYLLTKPVRAAALYYHGLCWLLTDDYDKAIDDINEALQLNPYIPDYWVKIPEIYKNWTDVEKDKIKNELFLYTALEFAEKYAGRFKNNPDIQHNTGVVYMWLTGVLKKDLRVQAWEQFRKAVSLDDCFVQGWESLAKCAGDFGDYQRQREIAKKILKLNPENSLAKEILSKK